MRCERMMICASLALVAAGCGGSAATGNQDSLSEVRSVSSEQPSEISQAFAGSSFTVGGEAAPGLSTTIHHFVATGSPGVAQIDALLVLKSHDPKANTTACPLTDGAGNKQDGYPVEVVSLTWVQTYADGSALSAAIVNRLRKKENAGGALVAEIDDKGRPVRSSIADPAQEHAVNEAKKVPAFACSDGVGFTLDVKGKVLQATGPMFIGWVNTTGTWHAKASIKKSLTTGNVDVVGLKYNPEINP